MGEKLPLECADISSLELIKGISDTLAFELLSKRYEIMRAAFQETRVKALQRAHGIGEKTAEKLLTYLDLTARCSGTEPYEVWGLGRRAIPHLITPNP
jgi:Holliday junction resolvasome RuvABC DNA-binding subunit